MRDTFDRFISREANGCWLWTGCRNQWGYGSYRSKLAHRVSYERHRGPVGDAIVCHTCDNPACCNPAHLWLGTPKSNAEDCSRKKRANNQHGGQSLTHCRHGHEFTPANTYWKPGKIAQRTCKECNRTSAREYQRRKAAAA